MKIHNHGPSFDWCHICGHRCTRNADIWFPENAEHGGPNSRYIRICALCGHSIQKAAEDCQDQVDPERAARLFYGDTGHQQ